MAFKPADYLNKLVVTDGDLAAELLSRGWQASVAFEHANVRRPDIVHDVAGAFLDAGAKVLVTNTAAANALCLADLLESDAGTTAEGLAEVLKLNRQGAAICRAATREHPAEELWVFGAMGPTERLLTLEEVDQTTVHEAYKAQAESLAEGGVDAILCRSFSEIQTLVIAVRAAAEATGLPVIGSMTFDCGPEQTETTLGVTVPQACAELVEAGAAMVGCDCGENPDGAPAVVGLMRERCDLPIWVKVNAGMPQLAEGRVVYPESPEEFAERLPALREAGASFVGGCCGARGEHIAAMAAAQRARRRGG